MKKKASQEKGWASGKIKTINWALNTGVIQQFDGNDVMFDLSELKEKSSPRIGQPVLYNLEKHSLLGSLAKNITTLDLSSKK